MELAPESADKLYSRAMAALSRGESASALSLLERALKQGDNPSWHSYLGYCIAKERGQVKKGLELCLGCVQAEPQNAVHYLNLGKVHLIAGQKPEALAALRQGIGLGENPEIMALLVRLGSRKPAVIPFLSRDNSLNKLLGLILSRLGMR